MEALDPEQRAQVEDYRSVIRRACPSAIETIKWNAPSYALDGEHRVTFNVVNRARRVQLVLHLGVGRRETKGAPPVMVDPFELVEWISDIRGVLGFTTRAELAAHEGEVEQILRAWFAVEPPQTEAVG